MIAAPAPQRWAAGLEPDREDFSSVDIIRRCPSGTALDWSVIDTVLLDMDGTLLDQRFDNWFWQELDSGPLRQGARHQPGGGARRCWRRNFAPASARCAGIASSIGARELGLDIAAHQARRPASRSAILPGAQEFLSRLELSGKRRVLLTNAHPVTLAIKNEQVRLTGYFDACYSTHAFHAPKEDAEFWPRFNAQRAVRSAAHAVRRRQPAGSRCGARFRHRLAARGSAARTRARPAQDTGRYAAVDGVADLM